MLTTIVGVDEVVGEDDGDAGDEVVLEEDEDVVGGTRGNLGLGHVGCL